MKFTAALLAAATLATFAAGSASAVVVTGLYNTGVGAGGVALAAGDGQVDGNYTIASTNLPGVSVGASVYTYKNPAYTAENPGSRWVAYSGSPFAGVGSFAVSTTFDLTGYDAASASISGLWGVDNEGEIFLNGVSTGIVLTGIIVENFNQLHSFTISSGFVSGINTLTFGVYDGGSPAAVRADALVLTANPVAGAVPEAATWTMLVAGFGLVGAGARRRRAIAA